MTRLSRAEMLVALGGYRTSLNEPARLEDAFAGFAQLLRLVQCYRLEGPSPASCAELLLRHM